MKKYITILLICLLMLTTMIFVFTGCNKEDSGNSDGESNNGSAKNGSSNSENNSNGDIGTESEVPTSKGIVFELDTDGKSYYVADYNGTSKAVKIPSSYNGKPVTKIGDEAFMDCSAITSVIIPDSVTSIGFSAFFSCYNLKNISLGNSITSLGLHSFSYCEKLTSITLPNTVAYIGDYAFSNCNSTLSIRYKGTETQWNDISKGTHWDYKFDNNGNSTQFSLHISFNNSDI